MSSQHSQLERVSPQKHVRDEHKNSCIIPDSVSKVFANQSGPPNDIKSVSPGKRSSEGHCTSEQRKLICTAMGNSLKSHLYLECCGCMLSASYMGQG